MRRAIAETKPMPNGMGNFGFADYYSPVTLKGDGLDVNLDADPLIAVARANNIVCRSVAKPKKDGTIKESWAVGDWDITIAGVIIAETKEELWHSVEQLCLISEKRQSLEITCPPINEQYGITRIAVKQLQLPFTEGELNQQFTITALSDTSHELLEEL